MDYRPPSPSARFYTNRSTPNSSQMIHQHQQVARTVSSPPQPAEFFDQFQGFSAMSTDHSRPRFGVYGYYIPEGDISPRMPIPNPVALGVPRPRVLQVDDDDSTMLELPCPTCANPPDWGHFASQFPQARMEGHCFPPGVTHSDSLYRPAPSPNCWQRLEDGYYPSPSCLQSARRGDPALLPTTLVSTAVAHHTTNTFRVPSDTEVVALSDHRTIPAAPPQIHSIEADHQEHHQQQRASTIYPDDSVSTSNSRPGAETYEQQRTLANDIVEVHDVCLAATQRYLEALRVNWDLRHGQAAGREGGAESTKRRAQGRWSPYAPPRTRRRAHSESYLDLMDCACNGSKLWEDGLPRQDPDLAQDVNSNPIPIFTNSLLHNIHNVCTLIWRRAQRDRDDVLSAEAKACRLMLSLHECVETIVLYNAVDAEQDPRRCWDRVVTAGREICQRLEDEEGMRLMGLE